MDNREAKAVLEYDAGCERAYTVQFYAYIRPTASGEARITTYAVKRTKRRGVEIAPVNVAWTSRGTYRCMNIWRSFYNRGPQICFNEARERGGDSWQHYGGEWSKPLKFADDASWYIRAPYAVHVVNPDALERTKYRYCAYGKYAEAGGSMSLIEYLRTYRRYGEIELLSKAGLARFVDRKFLACMREDRGLALFFRRNAEWLRGTRLLVRPADVVAAYRHGTAIEREIRAREARNRFRRCRLPKSVDRLAVWKWMDGENIEIEEYERYCGYARRAGADLGAFGVAMPRDFFAAIENMERAAIRNERRSERSRRHSLDAAIGKVHAMLSRVEGMECAGYVAAIPRSVRDLVAGGQAMHNCVGSCGYDRKIADGESFIVFLRRRGKPAVDIEIARRGWRVVQCYAKFNARPDDAAREFAAALAKAVAKAYRRAA